MGRKRLLKEQKKQKNPLVELLGKHLFLNHFGNYQLTPVQVHELFSRALEKLEEGRDLGGLDRSRLKGAILRSMERNSTNLEEYITSIYKTIPKNISEQTEVEKAKQRANPVARAAHHEEDIAWYQDVYRFVTGDSGKSWVFDFWAEVSKFGRRHKESVGRHAAMGVCRYLGIERKSDSDIEADTLFFPNKQRLSDLGHGAVWDYYSSAYPQMPERGLRIPSWVDDSCKMTRFDLETRKIQYELIGDYCVGDDNQPCDIRVVGPLLMMFFGELYNKDTFDFMTGTGWSIEDIFYITSGKKTWDEDVLGNRRIVEWYIENNKNVKPPKLKEKYLQDAMYVMAIIGPDKTEEEDPLDWGAIGPQAYQRKWLQSYLFNSPTLKAALNESLESTCEKMVSELKAGIKDLQSLSKKTLKSAWLKDYMSDSQRVIDYYVGGNVQLSPDQLVGPANLDGEIEQSQKQVRAKFEEISRKFNNYKLYLQSLYQDHYEEDQLDARGRPVIDPTTKKPKKIRIKFDDLFYGSENSKQIRDNDPLRELNDIFQNKIEQDWGNPIRVGGDKDFNRIAKIEELVEKSKKIVEKKFHAFTARDKEDFDLAKDYTVAPPRRIALMSKDDIISREYFDDIRPNRVSLWAQFLGSPQRPEYGRAGTGRVTRIPPSDAAIKDWRRNVPSSQVDMTHQAIRDGDWDNDYWRDKMAYKYGLDPETWGAKAEAMYHQSVADARRNSKWPTWGDLYRQFNPSQYKRIKGIKGYDPERVWNKHYNHPPGAHPLSPSMQQDMKDQIDKRHGFNHFQSRTIDAPMYRGGPSVRQVIPGASLPKWATHGVVYPAQLGHRPPRVELPLFNFRALARSHFGPIHARYKNIKDFSDPDTYDSSGDYREVEKYLNSAKKQMIILAAFEAATTPIVWMTPFKWAKPKPKWTGLPRYHEDIIGPWTFDALKYADDLKAGVYQTKTMGDHWIFPGISFVGKGIARVTGVKALEKKAAQTALKWLLPEEITMLKAVIIWAGKSGYRAIAALANTIYTLGIFLGSFSMIYKAFTTMPTYEDMFLKNMGILHQTPGHQYDTIEMNLRKTRTFMTDNDLYKNPAFREAYDNLTGEIDELLAIAKDQSPEAVSEFKIKYEFYCGLSNEAASVANKETPKDTVAMFNVLKGDDICGKEYTPAMAGDVIKKAMSILLSRVDRAYVLAKQAKLEKTEETKGQFKIIRTGFDTFKMVPTSKWYDNLEREAEDNLSSICATMFRDLTPNEREKEEEAERRHQQRTQDAIKYDMIQRGF